MSSPTFTKAFKDGKEVECIEHNWGFVPPSQYDVGIKLVKMVCGNYDNYGMPASFPRDWDYLVDRFYGKLSRESYELMYMDLKDVYDGKKTKRDLKFDQYFEGVK